MRSDSLSSTVHTQAALASTAQQWLEAYPDLYLMARAAALKILKKLVGRELEPDTIYWHRFSGAASSSLTFNGWEHYGSPIESMTLIELVVRRFRAGDQDDVDDLQWEGGFYTADSKRGVYNQTNEVRLLPQDVLRELWAIDFAQAYRTKMRAFWQTHGDDFLELSRINFQATLINARNQGTLTEQDLRALQRGAAASLTAPAVLKAWQGTAMGHQGLSVRTFDIAGYKARDILRIVDAQGRQLLYMPAQAPGLLVFDSETAVYQWVRERAARPASREGLLAHFSISGVDLGPLERLLATLPNTVQSASKPLLNQREQVIEGDAFVYLRDTARHEMEAQAHQLLTSNAQLRKQMWIGYLGAFAQVFTPFAPLGWPVALVLVGAGVASVGLRIDQAVNARSAAERKSGILGAITSAIGLLFDVIALFSTRPALNPPVTFNGEISAGLRLRPRPPTSISSPARELQVANPDMQGIELSHRGYWNRLGFVERSDRTPLYYTREISVREDPTRVPMQGFTDSQVSRVAGNLLDGRVLRTFGSIQGACLHAHAEYEAAYAVYEIDVMDVRSVSARENLGANERFTVSQLAAGSDARRLGDAVQDAYLHDVVHVDNALIDSSRIKLRPVEEWEEQQALELVPAAPPRAIRVVESTVLNRVSVFPPAFGQIVNSYGIEAEGELQIVKYDPYIDAWRKPSGRAWRFDPARD